MPWNPEQKPAAERADFIELVQRRDCTFTVACRHFGISRKTGYKWLHRATAPQPQPLRDRSRRPHHCPNRTPPDLEQADLRLRDYSWGGAQDGHGRQRGDVSWRGYDLLVGAGLQGERVGVEERPGEVVLSYAHRVLRRIPTAKLQKGRFI
jgi:transposase-like protein